VPSVGRWGLLALLPLVCSGQAEEPEPTCRIAAGEVTGPSDPRWRDPSCTIEVGAMLRVYVEEVDPAPARVRLDVHPACVDPKPLDAQVARVKAHLASQGFPEDRVDVVLAECSTPPRIDATVTE